MQGFYTVNCFKAETKQLGSGHLYFTLANKSIWNCEMEFGAIILAALLDNAEVFLMPLSMWHL